MNISDKAIQTSKETSDPERDGSVASVESYVSTKSCKAVQTSDERLPPAGNRTKTTDRALRDQGACSQIYHFRSDDSESDDEGHNEEANGNNDHMREICALRKYIVEKTDEQRPWRIDLPDSRDQQKTGALRTVSERQEPGPSLESDSIQSSNKENQANQGNVLTYSRRQAKRCEKLQGTSLRLFKELEPGMYS